MYKVNTVPFLDNIDDVNKSVGVVRTKLWNSCVHLFTTDNINDILLLIHRIPFEYWISMWSRYVCTILYRLLIVPGAFGILTSNHYVRHVIHSKPSN